MSSQLAVDAECLGESAEELFFGLRIGLNGNARPQRRQALQALRSQPGVEFVVGFQLFLQGLQGVQAGRQLGMAGVFMVYGLLAAAPPA